ncbi:MAG TPA: DnaJ C-terminal domain-containing protein [Dehalococcoidia bacterium]|nr:DnaJ C-terminal domain-containing protein [Dehalococcoidia bacterium]
MEYKDYYRILGVDKKASEKDIRTAFRKLARQYHPDVNPNNAESEAKFKEINEAYEVLSDPEKRRKYDELGPRWREYEQWQRAGGAAGANPFDGFGEAAPGGARYEYRTVTEDDLQDLFGDGGGFSDFFQTFFGGAGGRPGGGRRTTATGSRRGRDAEEPVEITIQEALNGTQRLIQMLQPDGSTRRLELKIPAGVTEGSRVRMAGQGTPGAGGGQPGDLYLRIHLADDPVFSRQGDDLQVDVPVDLATLVLGGEVEVPNPKGGRLSLRIPAGTQNNRSFRLRGQGLPRLRGGNERGDLIARVQAVLPETLTSEERELFQKLAALRSRRTAV